MVYLLTLNNDFGIRVFKSVGYAITAIKKLHEDMVHHIDIQMHEVGTHKVTVSIFSNEDGFYDYTIQGYEVQGS